MIERTECPKGCGAVVDVRYTTDGNGYVLAVTDDCDAIRWFVMGDHPAVRPFQHRIKIRWLCGYCGVVLSDHGSIPVHAVPPWRRVCPGNWIVTLASGRFWVLTDEQVQNSRVIT